MKIKLSKSQWEEMGKKAGWIKTAQGRMDRNEEEMHPTTGHIPVARSRLKPYYEIRVGQGLLHRYESLTEAQADFERILNDNPDDGDFYYIIEVSEKVLSAEHGKSKK